MNSDHVPYGLYEKYFKRVLDVSCGLMFIFVFFWLYILLVIMGIFFMRGNPFFIQKRPGKNGKIFDLIKFRTMDNRKDKNGNLLPDVERLNKYGKLLRKTSLDELPEIFNIVKGDMSIIGPRPLVPEYLPYYTNEEMHRHDVKPGLSGLAQVNGRNELQWEDRFAYDLDYVKKITFIGDVKILFLTIKKTIMREGVIVQGTGITVDFDKYRRMQNIDK